MSTQRTPTKRSMSLDLENDININDINIVIPQLAHKSNMSQNSINNVFSKSSTQSLEDKRTRGRPPKNNETKNEPKNDSKNDVNIVEQLNQLKQFIEQQNNSLRSDFNGSLNLISSDFSTKINGISSHIESLAGEVNNKFKSIENDLKDTNNQVVDLSNTIDYPHGLPLPLHLSHTNADDMSDKNNVDDKYIKNNIDDKLFYVVESIICCVCVKATLRRKFGSCGNGVIVRDIICADTCSGSTFGDILLIAD
ncbi:hypothetical protein HCN44_004783 [Aphidius gifuensis]|uniref:Uncharacterized protein n=1 Tax=Aphidius gifuensis TaxID=684658 RepID=A0A834XLX1_APHGI|nr:hypothetical protein HCN44_004783 [Aphidius gifuensis]